MKIIRIDGSLFFGSSHYIERALRDIDEINPEQTRVLIIGSGINFIDVAGAELLVREAQRRRKMGGDLYLCAIKEGVMEVLKKGDYLEELGRWMAPVYDDLGYDVSLHAKSSDQSSDK